MASKKIALASDIATTAVTSTAITSIKGFRSDLTCRGFQFEVGKTYEAEGKIKACRTGFHACPVDQHPLSVFEYYPPAGNRFFVVEQDGDRDVEGSKLASAKITLQVELSLGDLARRAVEWVFARANWKDGPVATGDNEGATASGYAGAATASGDAGAATASGKWGVAMSVGIGGKARAAEGNVLFLVERDDGYGPDRGKILSAWHGIAGQGGIKPDTFYQLVNGKPVEVI